MLNHISLFYDFIIQFPKDFYDKLTILDGIKIVDGTMEYIRILKQFNSKIVGRFIRKTEIYCFEVLYMLFEELL